MCVCVCVCVSIPCRRQQIHYSTHSNTLEVYAQQDVEWEKTLLHFHTTYKFNGNPSIKSSGNFNLTHYPLSSTPPLPSLLYSLLSFPPQSVHSFDFLSVHPPIHLSVCLSAFLPSIPLSLPASPFICLLGGSSMPACVKS